MSSVTIIALVLGTVALLLAAGYLNSIAEKAKIEKARRKAELRERQQRLESLSESLPRQFASIGLMQLLHRLELHFVNGILKNEENTPKLQLRAEFLQDSIKSDASYEWRNSEVKIQTEEQVKEARFQLESLQAQMVRAAEERLITTSELKAVTGHVQGQLIDLYLDYFNTTGQRFSQQGQVRQAQLAYERAVKLLKRQTLPKYTQRLAEFEQLLKQASEKLLEQNSQGQQQDSQLAGMAESLGEESWKKKQLYD